MSNEANSSGSFSSECPNCSQKAVSTGRTKEKDGWLFFEMKCTFCSNGFWESNHALEREYKASQARKGIQIRASLDLVSVVFQCRICGGDAGKVVLDASGKLSISGIGSNTSTTVVGEMFKAIRQALTNGRVRDLFEMDRFLVPFYCPKCDCSYCGDHWHTRMVFDDEPGWGGWYDCTMGTCPEGHERMVED